MKIDRETWTEWLDQDLDGCLAAPESAALEELRSTDAEVRREQQDLESLHRIIATDFARGQIAVHPGFSARVMESLPQTWWERRQANAGLPSWSLPLAVMLILALGGVWMLASSEAAGRVTGIGMVVLDFMQTTALAGAGMLFATWRGFSLGLAELFAGSILNFLAAASTVACLNLLCLSLIRRRRSPVAEKADSAARSQTPC